MKLKKYYYFKKTMKNVKSQKRHTTVASGTRLQDNLIAGALRGNFKSGGGEVQFLAEANFMKFAH
jgi:hypothetical protein